MTGTLENQTQFLDTSLKKCGGVELPFEPYKLISYLPQTHLLDLSSDESTRTYQGTNMSRFSESSENNFFRNE